jgi:parvulin-like peptidyl-prolyl isomerase
MRKLPCMASTAILWAVFAHAGVVDRVAVVVGNQVITESEVDEELRVTEFQNQEPLDLAPDKRRAAAERLVDQQLIRNEMRLENSPMPPEGQIQGQQENFQRQHYASEGQFEAALRKYGITKEQLGQHLLWELAAVRFVDFRFRGLAAAEPPVQSADRLKAGSSPSVPGSDAQLEAWLKDARSQTRIEFKENAFQ